MNNNDVKLIPELADWNNGNGIALEDWIGCVGSHDHALGYTTLFWPSFYQYDDCIFTSEADPQIYLDWMKSTKGDKTKVEVVMNHSHLLHLFCSSDFKPNKELLVRLGHIIKEMWACKLSRDFPERRFEVSFWPEVDNLIDLQVTFYQVR